MPGHHHSSHHSSSHHSTSHHTTHHTDFTHHPSSSPVGLGTPAQPSGRGCLGPIIGAAIVGIVIVAIVGFVVVGALKNVGNSVSSAFNSGISNSTGISEDPTVVADLQIMHASLDKHLPAWEAQNDTVVHHVSVAEAGLPSDFNTKEVVYGHCTTSQFYLLVLNITPPEGTTADTEGYEFVPGGNPDNCSPTGWRVMSTESAAPDWYFVTIDTTAATAAPAPTAEPRSAQ